MSEKQKSLAGDEVQTNTSGSSDDFQDEFKRFTAEPKKVEDVTPDDIRVRIAGVVINREEDSFLLDDGTGSVRVMDVDKELETNKVRVIGKVMPSEDSWTLQAEAIQEWEVDGDLHNEVSELLEESPYF